MNGRSAVSSAHRNRAARRVVVVAQVAAVVDKAEAVLVVMAVKVVVAQAAKVAKAEADVQVASVVRHREQGHGHKPRHRSKTPRLLAHGVCGSD